MCNRLWSIHPPQFLDAMFGSPGLMFGMSTTWENPIHQYGFKSCWQWDISYKGHALWIGIDRPDRRTLTVSHATACLAQGWYKNAIASMGSGGDVLVANFNFFGG